MQGLEGLELEKIVCYHNFYKMGAAKRDTFYGMKNCNSNQHFGTYKDKANAAQGGREDFRFAPRVTATGAIGGASRDPSPKRRTTWIIKRSFSSSRIISPSSP
jgi:hypothetical protein